MNDDKVEAILRAVLAVVDRVPEAALAVANAAIGWRDLDEGLALFAAEPELAASHLRGTRPRLLTFRKGQTVIELEVSCVAGIARLLGQLDPPREADVTIESAVQPRNTHADGHGRFSVFGLNAGWMRIIVTGADRVDGRAATEWFRA
jgi:hypothetical protein